MVPRNIVKLSILRSPLSMSLVLPWEVLERVIDHFVILRSFSLTCRQLRPRTLLFMMESCHFHAKDEVFAFCDFLQAKSEFLSLIQSLFVCPIDFLPFPLIRILPNISTLRFIIRRFGEYARPADRPVVDLHPSALSCYRVYGERIRTLSLDHLSFTTYSDFFRLVLAFPNATEIICQDVLVKIPPTNASAIDVVKRKLSKQPRLETIKIYSGVDETVTLLLLECARCTLQTLMLTGQLDDIPPAFTMPSQWKRLHTLTIELELGEGADIIEEVTEFLKNFRPPSLEDVSVHFLVTHRHILNQRLHDERLEETSWIDVCSQLEAALSTFRRQRLSFLVSLKKPARQRLWTRELGQLFPALRDSEKLTVACKSIAAVGHKEQVHAVVVSPDSTWIASGSEDNTIILWDSDGQLCHEWVPHYGGVNSLAFSPDSRFLASGGHDRKVVVWDVNQDARRVATIKGHRDVVCGCAWSPDGTMIASGANDHTVRLWSTKTFQQLYLCDGGHVGWIDFVCFSPDGRWLASKGANDHCCIWDVASGTLHKVFPGHRYWLNAAAFDPGSRRLATTSRDQTVRIWDVETGEPILVLQQHTNWVEEVEFSPDGSLLLSASWDQTANIWDASTGVMKMSPEGHSSLVHAARFSPCGRYIASASSDKTVRLWRTSDGLCVATFSEHQGQVWHVAFSPDGKTLSSGADDGTVFIRRLDQVIPDNF